MPFPRIPPYVNHWSHAWSGCNIHLLRQHVVLVFVDKVREASVLFLDNPVGAGFSYVNESVGNYTTNMHEITDDLVSFTRQFIDRFPQFSVNVSSLIVCNGKPQSGFIHVSDLMHISWISARGSVVAEALCHTKSYHCCASYNIWSVVHRQRKRTLFSADGW